MRFNGQSLVLAGGLCLMAPAAFAELKYENNSGGSTLLYGQLDPAYLSFDDGVSKTDAIVDNTNSNSRVGIWVRQPFGEHDFSFNFETGLGFRPSAAVSQNFIPDALDWERVFIRKVDFSLNTANAGRFSAGQGSMATDGVVHSDLSGTTLVVYASIPDTAGAFRFRQTDGTLSTRTIVGSFGDYDGGRLGRIRYDTPSFSGFTVSASYGKQILLENSNLETADIALRYAGEFGQTKVRGAIGYARVKTDALGVLRDTIGSVSMLHTSGFSLTLAAGRRSNSGPTSSYGYGKIGYQANWFTVGKTALAIDYNRGSDRSVAGARSTSMGIGAVQHFDRVNIEGYLGFRRYQLSEPTQSYRDASSVLFGARWKF